MTGFLSWRLLRTGAAGAAFLAVAALHAQDPDTLPTPSELKKMSLEELMDVKVSLVSRQSENLAQSPSSVQVISSDDIRRSGAINLADVLRLASNLQVARIDGRQWAVSARGQNASLSNKLLVMIDGRTLYTPLYAGVFWDAQHLPINEIDRVEVISGPGGTLWGSNAVNGVINIVTKSAENSQGAYASVAAGTFMKDLVSVRYGGRPSANVYYDVWARHVDQDGMELSGGKRADNGWGFDHGGFRMDWLTRATDRLTVTGSAYGGDLDQVAPGTIAIDGQYVLARWTRSLSEASEVVVQGFADRTARLIPRTFKEDLRTFDFDFSHRFPLTARSSITWGAGYRLSQDQVGNSAVLSFKPPYQDLQLFNLFAQDQILLWPERLRLTLGSKLEHNDYTGFEIMPSGRLAWTPGKSNTLWAAVSRAVRSPSRIDADFYFTVPTPTGGTQSLDGGPDFASEILTAYEAGWRVQPMANLTASVSAFYNVYDDLRSVEVTSPGHFEFMNGEEGEVRGVELSLGWQTLSWWQVRAGATALKEEFRVQSGHSDISSPGSQGNDPEAQYGLQSMMDLPYGFQLNAVARYVSELPTPVVPYYATVDLSVVWAWQHLEVTLSGFDLAEMRHAEFGPATANRQQVPRSFAARVTGRF